MFSLSKILSICVLGAALIGVEARQMTKQDLKAKQAEAAQRWENSAAKRPKGTGGGVKNITFSNPKASREFTGLMSY